MLFDDAVAALLLLRLSTTVKSLWGLPGRTSPWSSTPGHPICGCRRRTASAMPVVRHTAQHYTILVTATRVFRSGRYDSVVWCVLTAIRGSRSLCVVCARIISLAGT